jgi:hypothetical protein
LASARWLVVAVVVAFAAGGCGGEDEQTTMPPQSTPAQDRVWLADLGTWLEGERGRVLRFAEAFQASLADTSQRARVRSALDQVEGCGERLEARVGSPPGRRFRRAARLMRAACNANDSWAAAQREALDDPAKLTDAGELDLAAQEAFVKADEGVYADLLARRKLPRAGKSSSESRVETTLSRAGTRLAGRAVEVRCWSRADWERVKAEWTAFAAVADVSGFADVAGSSAHLEPAVCEALADFVYGSRTLPRERDERLDVAWSIGVLAHEVEHMGSDRRGEQAVECFAMQRLDLFAQALGASVGRARTLATEYATRIYPDAPREYRSESRCRNGGELDLDRSSVWP